MRPRRLIRGAAPPYTGRVTVLVTGGAGYIGAHVVRLLRGRGDQVVLVDDLSTGRAERVAGLPLVQLDLAESDAPAAVASVLAEHRVDAVIHFAARKRVDESVARPAWYYQQNVGALANLLLAMEQARVTRLVFSSSAAVYGRSEGAALSEETATLPMNPYGETKLVGEHLVAHAAVAFGVRATSLRYFNVAGAGWPELGDTAVLNLVPMVFERLDADQSPVIFGGDYPTADGTCVRDYVHVLDLAEAHLAALDATATGEPRHDIYNVGTGTGSSVREMVDEILRVSGAPLAPEVRGRRAGDPAAVVADPELIAERLGWRARRGLVEIVESAWAAHATRGADAAADR